MIAQNQDNPIMEVPPADWAAAWPELVQFWPVLAISFAVSFALTPVMRKLALANGIVDLPDAKRKAHPKPVAYLGGLAIFIGWFAGIGTFIFLVSSEEATFGNLLGENTQSISYIALGAVAIVLTGLFDDVYGISARGKVGGQLFAAAALAQTRVVNELIYRCFEILNLPFNDFMLQIVGTVMIALLVVGCCNALNLIDGLDGLASGVTAIAMAGMLLICLIVLARYHDNPALTSLLGIPILLCIASIGSVLGFLPYNFNPASIFMGDTGSMLLGYLCVTTILQMSRIDNDGGLAPTVFTAAVICFSLPLTDTALAIVRRKLNGKPIFAPDAMHIHHMLRRCGLSVKKSVFTMYAMGLAFAAVGTTFVAFSVRWKSLLVGFAAMIITIVGIGYIVSRRLQATEKAHPKPAEAPETTPEPALAADSPAPAPGEGY